MRCENHETASDQVSTTLHLDPADLVVTDTPNGLVLRLPGLRTGGEPGAPALPRTRVRLAVPAGTWPRDLVVETEEWARVVDGPVLVAAAQPARPGVVHEDRHNGEGLHCSPDCSCRERVELRAPLTQGLPGPGVVPPDPERYAAAAADPARVASAVAIETIGTTRVAVVEVSPVRMTRDGGVELATSLRISVRLTDTPPLGDRAKAAEVLRQRLGRDVDPDELRPRPEPTITGPAHASRLRDLASASVLNPELVDRIDWPGALLDLPAEYLVITDDRLWDAATVTAGAAAPGLVAAFQRLVAAKRARGVSAKVVTITDVVAGRYGDFRTGSRDLQEVLRRFLVSVRERWGVSWLLLGGDVGVVPVRLVAGAFEGDFEPAAVDPPADRSSYWTGSFLKVNLHGGAGLWWDNSTTNTLVRPDTGLRIPYDPSGTAALGWLFTAADWSTPSAVPTDYVRVNGSAAQVDARLQFLYTWNTLPTDLYYASLTGWVLGSLPFSAGGQVFDLPWVHEPEHHWDALGNGVYGQHLRNGYDLDGVHLQTDLSVGRAPVQSAAEADAFVDKVLAYERLGRGWALPVDRDWPSRVLLASSDWGGPEWFASTDDAVPGDRQYHHAPAAGRSLLKLRQAPDGTARTLVAHVSDTDRRVLPLKHDPDPAVRGWYYARSGTDLTPSQLRILLPWLDLDIPIQTAWIVVHGPAAERTPALYLLDVYAQDGSMSDQETLRRQLGTELPAYNDVSRLYEDELDLTLAERVAAPVQYLTADRLRAALDAGPHLVSLSGHGSGDGCCGGSVWMARALRNGRPGFIGYADSCLTSQFDADDAFGEALLTNPDGGAVGYVGNTRFSWIGVGDDFQRAFFHRLTSTRHLGLLNDSRIGVYGATGAWTGYDRWAVFTLNLLGDPELMVHRTRLPGLRLTVDATRLHVRVELLEEQLVGPPVPPGPRPSLQGVLVHVQAGELSHRTRTDADGVAVLPAEFAEASAPLQVTASREDLLTSYLEVDAPAPASEGCRCDCACGCASCGRERQAVRA